MKTLRIILWFVGIGLLLVSSLVAYFVGKKGFENSGNSDIVGAALLVLVIWCFAILAFWLLGLRGGTGMPREFLPNEVRFKKLYERRHKRMVEFLVRDHSENASNFFSIPANILLSENGKELKEIPDEFQVRKSRRIKEKTKLKKRPKIETVYYLLPITKDK